MADDDDAAADDDKRARLFLRALTAAP